MTFLAPLFLFGAAAIALPIVFHLIRRSSREKISFSSLMFLSPSPPRITRRGRLEHILLLLLRCFAICLLALAFARPLLPRSMSDPPSAKTTRRIITLLDTSASMRRDNLWPDAIAKVEAAARNLSPEDELAVFSFAESLTPLLTFDDWRKARAEDRFPLLRERLSSAKPTWAAGFLDAALIRAVDEFQHSGNSRGDAITEQIVVVSDFEEGSRLDQLRTFSWPKSIRLRAEIVKPKRRDNAGLSLAADREESATLSPAPKVRIVNARDSGKEQFEIRWAATQPSASNDIVKAYVPPGQARVFAAPRRSVGAQKLVLVGDENAFDNEVFWAEPKPLEVAVLYFGGDAENDPAKPLYYLRRAFQESAKVSLLTGATAVAALSKNIDAAPLAMITGEVPATTLEVLRSSLIKGRTALVVVQSNQMAGVLRQLLGNSSITIQEASSATYAMLGQISFEHPIFAPFADPRYSDFTKIHFWKHWQITEVPGGRVLARFDDHTPAITEVPLGTGRLLVLAAGWQPAESQLALSSKFVPLLYSILEYSGAPRPRPAQFLVSNPVPMPSAFEAVSQFAIAKPDGTSARVRAGGEFTGTDIPGIYTVTFMQFTQQFAVNISPAEMKTAPLPIEDLERMGIPVQTQPAAMTRTAEASTRQLHSAELENRQKLWRWLIIALFVLLMVETWLAGSLTRRSTTVEAAA